MKKLRKLLGLFAAAFAMCMVFALGAKVNAADVEIGVIKEDNNVNLMSVSNVAIDYVYSDGRSAGFTIGYNGNYQYTRVGIFDINGNLVAQSDNLSYALITGLQPNKLYYYRAQSVSGRGGVATSAWSEPKAFTTILDKKVKVKGVKGEKAFTVKIPKIAGIKNYTVSMSTKRDKGFKKVKTVKPGKKVTITKMKKKSFKFGKTYYIKITPKTNTNLTCGGNRPSTYYVYFYKTYRLK